MGDPRYVHVEDTCWPVDVGEVQWCLRYGNQALLTGCRFIAASVVASYQYLMDPSLTQGDAIAALKRGRKAHASSADRAERDLGRPGTVGGISPGEAGSDPRPQP